MKCIHIFLARYKRNIQLLNTGVQQILLMHFFSLFHETLEAFR